MLALCKVKVLFSLIQIMNLCACGTCPFVSVLANVVPIIPIFKENSSILGGRLIRA